MITAHAGAVVPPWPPGRTVCIPVALVDQALALGGMAPEVARKR